ncbi:PREDICTED: uncharacterized protein LOC105367637 [Ceratosolen solmsi marchali]|uniref:Uncharacterized protein LOC105367637 n=1 Tax=Ceratosolen solmsi marchali TaxID=326594 RepID=A0AAJ6YUM2_9HYME|nr:PREDICTED: uncharacterized protein LOC105367637 [Ceratosolen solmsi marchali]
MISITAIEIDIIMLLSLLQETLTLIGGLLIIYLIYIIFIRGRDKLPNNATHMAHTALRKLVDRTVDEVCKLSNSQNSPSNNTNDDQVDANDELTMSRRNHDDLFKMIIVNKVMEKSRFDQFNKNNNISNFQLLNA